MQAYPLKAIQRHEPSFQMLTASLDCSRNLFGFLVADLPTPAIASAVIRARRAWISPRRTSIFYIRKRNLSKPLKSLNPVRQFLSNERQKWSVKRQKSVAILSV